MLKPILQLYSIFHLNISYSSIEKEQRTEVIDKCYWPLLRLARKLRLPFGIEATGYTLESIESIDPSWVAELRKLINDGICEFIGSGYKQIIGPLVPAKINEANLRIGNEVYEKLIGFRPTIILVNEQAYSAGLIQLYLNAGYRAIIMEWDNPACFNTEWDPKWRYYPQYACNQNGNKIALIWNNSIAFQKFQHFAHNEIELDEYLNYLSTHISDEVRLMSLYSNDVEIFDFRPGRYHIETKIGNHSEWERIEKLFNTLQKNNRFKIIAPGEVLSMMGHPEAGNDLFLESSICPVPVKKQEKYNITRWALTGRDDLSINSACWRIYEALKDNPDTTESKWKELCYLWSSDFRTHITEKRWIAYCERLNSFEKLVKTNTNNAAINKSNRVKGVATVIPEDIILERQGRYLTVETNSVRIRLNCQRGLAIDALWFKNIADKPLIGTLQHGYYDDIATGADFYSGHLILEAPGQPKETDLSPVETSVTVSEDNTFLIISVKVPTVMGPVHKSYYVYRDAPRIKLYYELHWRELPIGSLRLGHITIIPSSFDCNSLFYRTHNGGSDPETFLVKDCQFNHGSAVSSLVSAKCAVGMTENIIEMGDSQRMIKISSDRGMGAVLGMLTYRKIKETYFYRLALSAAEMDDTSRQNSPFEISDSHNFCLTLSPGPIRS